MATRKIWNNIVLAWDVQQWDNKKNKWIHINYEFTGLNNNALIERVVPK